MIAVLYIIGAYIVFVAVNYLLARVMFPIDKSDNLQEHKSKRA